MSAETSDGHPAKRIRVGTRTILACINCKQRKLKCDGQVPKCGNCARADRECLVEDPATGLHRPRDYIRSLEARVAYLENLLQEVHPEVAQDHFEAFTAPEIEPSPSSALGALSQTSLVPRGDAEPHTTEPGGLGADALSDEVALLCLSAAGREPQYFGPSSAVSFSRIASTAMGLPRCKRDSGTQWSNVGDTRNDRRASTSIELPAPDKMALLSKAYFSNIHPQYPFMHRPTVQKMESECSEANIKGDLGAASNISLFFVFMVYAIGSLALGHSDVDAAEGYYAMALDYVGSLLELDNLQSIQAILCCAVYSVRSPVGVSLWKISGMAIRHCVELGYHRSTERYRSSADVLTKEMSKRCFWVAYDIDRVASFILGRPVGISDSDIDVELPSDIDDEDITSDSFRSNARSSPGEPPTIMTGALHVIKLRQLWSKFSDHFYLSTSIPYGDRAAYTGVSTESLRHELEEWRATTPDTLDYSPSRPLSVFASKSWFQLAYNYSILLLYRHYITGTPNSSRNRRFPQNTDSRDASDGAFEVCAAHAREICLLYRRIYQSQGSHVQFTWGSLHILFLAGLTYLYCLWRSPRLRMSTQQTAVMSTCMACSTVLVIIADRWSQASSYRDIFETLSQRTISMMYHDNRGAEPLRLGLSGLCMPSTASNPAYANATGDPSAISANEAEFAPLQDWITGLDYMPIPGDPRWLAQELIQGIREF